MKRSRAVRLTLVASASTAALTAAAACGRRQEAMNCVDRTTNRVVPDSLCAAAERLAGSAAGTSGGGSGSGYYGAGYHTSPFLWYYGGRVLNGYMSAGSYSPLAGYRYRSSGGYTYDRPSSGGGFFGGRGSGSGTSSPSAHGSVSRGGFGATGAGHAASS